MSFASVALWSCLLGVLWGLAWLNRKWAQPDLAVIWSSLAWVVLGVGLSRVFLWEPMMVQGNSMAPTLTKDDVIVVNKHAFGFHLSPLPWRLGSTLPSVGDIVVFNSPQGESWVKRVVALPGDHIVYIPHLGWFKNNQYLAPCIPNAPVDVPAWMSVLNAHKINLEGYTAWSIKIPEHRYFVLGDNVNHSIDSRRIGPIYSTAIAGRVSQ